MNVIRIPTREQGNPYYPLPADYFKHSQQSEYAKMARVNAARQWLLPFSPDQAAQKAAARIESLRFFDHYYFWPDAEADWDPFFYDSEPRDTPQFHWDIVGGIAVHRLNLVVAPRGSAKSTLQKKNIPHVMVTRPGYTYIYTTSTHTNAIAAGEHIRSAIYDNARIYDDFAHLSEFGGKIKPGRGDKPTATQNFHLTNRSWIRLSSAESRQRGMRPRRYVLDDPEYDANSELSVSQLRENMSVLITKVILPMIMRPDCGCDWIGTFVSKRHMLWQAMATYVNEHGIKVADDPRFDFWNRIFIKAALLNKETGEIESCWPDMWPKDEATIEANPRLRGTVSLQRMEEMLTTPVFRAEMLGLPGASDDHGFAALTNEKHGYRFSQVDELFKSDPRNSQTLIHFYREATDAPDVWEPVEMTMEEFFLNASVVQTIDYAHTHKTTSDFKVCSVLALYNATNELFMFDIYGSQERPGTFIEQCFRQCDDWKVDIMSPEHTSESENLITSLKSTMKTRAIEYMGIEHEPRFFPYKPGRTDKTARIDRLGYRFEKGLVKLPLEKKHKPHWKPLFDQIAGFSPGAESGGLKKDDHVDVLSMGNEMFIRLKGVKIRHADKGTPDTVSIDMLEQLRNGGQNSIGVDLRGGVDLRYIPQAMLEELMQSNLKNEGDNVELI